MNRRSFLQLVGLAPVVASVPVVAMPAPKLSGTGRNCIGLPQMTFRAVNEAPPSLGEWMAEMKRAQERLSYSAARGAWPEWSQ